MVKRWIAALIAGAALWSAQSERAHAAGPEVGACAASAPVCEAPAGPDPVQFTCAPLQPLPSASAHPSVEALGACFRELNSCVRDLLGPQADSLIYDSGEAVLQVNRSQADRISSTAKRAREKGSTPDEISLSGQPELLSLVAALSASEASRKSLRDAGDALSSVLMGPARIFLLDRMQGLVDDMWLRIASALRACRRITEARAVPKDVLQSLPEAVQASLRVLIDETLLCSLRSRSELVRIPLFVSWPGCPCSGGRGRILGGTCISSPSPDRFAEHPIDQRVVTGTLRFLDLLRERVAPWQPIGVELDGCTLERLETGPNVRDLHRHPERGLHAGDVSDHARGTACDLVSVTLLGPDCQPWKMELNRLAVGSDGEVSSQGTPFFDALEGEARRRGKSWEELRGFARKRGVDAFYRTLASGAPPLPAATDARKQLYFGAAVYEALRGARFHVYDPTYNRAHRDHFHFEVPESDRE